MIILINKSKTFNNYYSWGEGCSGKLGHGDEDSILAPTEIKKLGGINIIQVACGGEFCLALSGTIF